MKESTITECVIKRISKPIKIKNGYRNEFYYLVEIYSPHKKNWKWKTSFMSKTKKELLKQLKEEYQL